jgi:hypothetical protein
MTDRVELSFVLGAGVVAEVLLLTLPSLRLGHVWRLALVVAVGCLALLFGRNVDPSAYAPVLIGCALFALAAFIFLKDEILRRVSETNLLLSTLVFWYLWRNVDAPREVLLALAAVAILPTAGTVLVAMVVRNWGFRVRLLCYVWFLVLSSAMSVLLLRFGDLSFAYLGSFDPPNLLSLFLTGMCITYLAASVFYIWTLIPIFGKVDWQENSKLMAGRFADYEMRIPEVALTILVPGGIFLLNTQYHWIPVTLLATAALVLQRYGSRFLFPARPSAAPPSPEAHLRADLPVLREPPVPPDTRSRPGESGDRRSGSGDQAPLRGSGRSRGDLGIRRRGRNGRG